MSIEILEDVSLAPLTTFKVGGPARYFATARSENDIAAAFEYADLHKLDVFVLGGGSNILVSDKGFGGLALHIVLSGIDFGSDLRVAAGENWDTLVAKCVERGLAGFECLSGIPGSVGGTPVQNVGAYGQEVSETIVSVRCFDRESRNFIELSNQECGFEYRKSIFNSTQRDRYVVLGVTFALSAGSAPKIVYKDLKDHFGIRQPTLRETRDAVLKIRRAKSMVIDESDPNSRSAGSFFKNPIVPVSVTSKIEESLKIQNVPTFRLNESEAKIPAAWLIENAGFSKGYIRGNTGISSNHSLAIINRGSASANEIVELERHDPKSGK
jgi:UDP-N-acetylmuramate dehydrogenase